MVAGARGGNPSGAHPTRPAPLLGARALRRGAARGPGPDPARSANEDRAQVFKGKFDSLGVAFRAFDKNRDGKVSREEMTQGLLGLALPLSRAQINAIVRRADADGSGEVRARQLMQNYHMPQYLEYLYYSNLPSSRRSERRRIPM